MKLGLFTAIAMVGIGSFSAASAETVKVFILAGQSNMQGHGRIEGDPDHNGGKGSLSYMADNDPKYEHLRKGSSSWVERKDVSIWFLGREGRLAPGYGARESMIGPELGFGHVIGDHLEEPVFLIKTAWGGKSLAADFRPPSAGGQVGPFYTEMLEHVKSQLEGLKDDYEVAGFGWHQGWNDGCDMAMCQEYEDNLKHFIRDIRQALGVETLPFVIAESGFGGVTETNDRRLMIREAQAAPSKSKEFKDTVAFVKTGQFWRTEDESPSKQGYHWNSNAETYYQIGAAMGEAMKELLGSAGPAGASPSDIREFRSADGAKTFKGRLIEYHADSQLVTVRRVGGKLIKFKLEHLHPDDREFIQSHGGK